MTTYQQANLVAGSTQEAMKVRYTAKTHASGGRRGGVSREVAQAIVDATHGETCAYSNATRGSIDVTLSVV